VIVFREKEEAMIEEHIRWCRERLDAIADTLKSGAKRTILFGDGHVETTDDWKADLERRAGLLRRIVSALGSR
jgi:prepilin-type processing-associated H-X9-DG protein